MSAFDEELAFLDARGHNIDEHDDDASLHHHQLVTSPLLKYSVLSQHFDAFPSRGLLGTCGGERIYINTNAPSSGVVCGVQGAGKSHTVSCILESALIPNPRIGSLPEPLAALVFHFDEQDCGRPCEAAYLSCPSSAAETDSHVPQVTVLCSPSNLTRRSHAYASLPNVRVAPLFLSEQDLTADRMLAIMGCDNLETMPLYMHSVLLIIRNMGVDAFKYSELKNRLNAEKLNPMQKAMLKLRTDLLDAFIRPGSPDIRSYFAAGEIVLVDLTDPFLDGLTAAVMFDIVLGSFIQWQTTTGKIAVLDEAHKYLTNSDNARLTQSVANIIRLQRHLATRVIIATQEPTVVPRTILDLASFIICHRFSSPSWCTHLANHVSTSDAESTERWFEQVMLLATGEGIVFSPAAVTGVRWDGKVELLGRANLKVRVRPRLTTDGGASLLAVGRTAPSPQRSRIKGASPLATPLTPPDSELYLPSQRERPTAHMESFSAVPIKDWSNAIAPLPSSPHVDWATIIDVSQAVAAAAPVTPKPSGQTKERTSSLTVPARLKQFCLWMKRNGQVGQEFNQGDIQGHLFWIGKKKPELWPEATGKKWFKVMLKEAEDYGVIQLIEPGHQLRLLHNGPFTYA